MPSRLRIAFLSPFVFRMARGIERFTVELANQLARLDQEVTIIARAPDGQKATPSIAPGVQVRQIPAFRYLESRWDIPFYAAGLVRQRYDVVNIFFAGYGEAEALRLARRVRPTAINFIVGYPYQQAPFQFREFARHGVARYLDGVIVKSRFMAPEVERFFGKEVEVIPNGIDLDYFRRESVDAAALRAELKIRPDERVLLTVAALEERKGILSVIQALPRMLQDGQPVRYLVVGEGRDRVVIEQCIRELNLDAQVALLGSQTDVRPFYKLADIFLLPSYGEGFPNAFLEALAMELPIIVSAHPPYDELVQPAFGLQVNEKAPAAVAAAIEDLLRQPDRWRAMGEAGRSHARAVYAWPLVANRYLESFRAELKTRGANGRNGKDTLANER